MPPGGSSARHHRGSPQKDKEARRKWATCLKSLKKRNRGKERGRDAGQCHISIFPLCSIAQARFGEVRFSEQETDLERKSLTFIYITQTFSTGNSWGSVCLLLVLSYSLRILGTWSNNVISPHFFILSVNGMQSRSFSDLVRQQQQQQHLTEHRGSGLSPEGVGS